MIIKNSYSLLALLFFKLLFCYSPGFSQTAGKQPLIKPLQDKVFIKEHGQFERNSRTRIRFTDTVFYGVENMEFSAYFTHKGIVFHFPEWRMKKEDEENESFIKKPEEQKTEAIWHTATMEWLGAKQNVEIVAEDKTHNYYNYGGFYGGSDDTTCYNFVPAYKKITYKNLYPGVDVVFEIPEEGGIKYKFIVAPNITIPKIAFKWEGVDKISLDKNGNLQLKNKFKRKSLNSEWRIQDHPPVAYTAHTRNNIPVNYTLKKNVVEFSFLNGPISSPEGIIIDPWLTNTTYADLNRALDIQEDSLGNIFIQGNHTNYHVEKYNSSGVLQWSYVTYSIFLGDIAVDNPGNVYIIGGYCTGKRQKLNSAGVQQWSQGGLCEEWRLTMNYSKTVLAICGYFINPGGNNLARLDMATGNISDQIAYNEETRAIAADCDGDMYSLHLPTNTLRKTNADFTPGGVTPSGLSLFYSGPGYAYNPAYSPDVYQGFNGILVQGLYVYMYDGITLRRFNKATLAHINTVSVPGGVNYACSGLAADRCGNIYAGTTTGIAKYDSALTYIEAIPTPGAVYDILLSTSGNLIACGAGFLGSYSINCTPPQPLNVAISGTDASCNGGTVSVSVSGGLSPYTYFWEPGGYTTASVDSLPPGTYTCTVTDPFCNNQVDSVTVNQIPALSLSVGTITNESCPNSLNGSASMNVSGGTSPYSFSWNTSPVQTTQTASGLPAGVYLCTVTDADSCQDTLTVIITVKPKPVADFSSSKVCHGAATVFSDSSTTASGTISSWSWNYGDNTIPGFLPNLSHLYTNAGNYSATLIVTNNFGCADTVTKQVNVYFNPVANYTVQDVCLGDSVLFNDSSFVDTSASITTYLWVLGDGTPTVGLQSPSHLYTNAGLYSVTLLVTTNQSCSDAVNKSVNVFDPPVAAFTVGDVCLLDSAVFINSSLNPSVGTIASVLWSFGDGSLLNNTALNPHHLYNAAGNYPVSLITRSSNLGCADTLTDSIVVFPMPVAAFSTQDVCQGQAIDFIDSSSVSNGNIVTGWGWNFGDGGVSTLQNASHVYDAFGQYTVTLIVTSNNGCKDTISHAPVVHPLPSPVFSTSNICWGDYAVFNDLSTIPLNISNDNLLSWAWDFGDTTPLVNNQNTTHLYNSVGSYSVELKVVSDYGCVDSVSETVVVNPNPDVIFTAVDTIGCEPLCVNFADASSITSGMNAAWKWNLGNGDTISNSTAFNYCYTNDSTFVLNRFSVTLTVTSDSGCVSSATKTNHITVYPESFASFNTSPTSATITDPVISISNSSTGAISWDWSFGDTDTSSLHTPPNHTYADTGSYLIRLITNTQYNCADTSYQTIVVEPDFMLYIPSAFTPNEDGVNDTFIPKGMFFTEFEMLIFDRWGNLVYRTDTINKPWNGKVNNGDEYAQKDVYVYVIKATDLKREEHTYRGTVTLIR